MRSVLAETAVRLKLRAPGEPVISSSVALQKALARPLIRIVEPTQSPARADRRVIVFFMRSPKASLFGSTKSRTPLPSGCVSRHYLSQITVELRRTAILESRREAPSSREARVNYLQARCRLLSTPRSPKPLHGDGARPRPSTPPWNRSRQFPLLGKRAAVPHGSSVHNSEWLPSQSHLPICPQ